MAFADVAKVDEVSVVAVGSPLTAVPFANELAGETRDGPVGLSFRKEAQSAAEIVKAAKEFDADLIVLASGSGGLSDTILLGSTAQRVQYSAPCPILVSHPRR